jgi:hypothetical protein
MVFTIFLILLALMLIIIAIALFRVGIRLLFMSSEDYRVWKYYDDLGRRPNVFINKNNEWEIKNEEMGKH